jgi:hypothetical protein
VVADGTGMPSGTRAGRLERRRGARRPLADGATVAAVAPRRGRALGVVGELRRHGHELDALRRPRRVVGVEQVAEGVAALQRADEQRHEHRVQREGRGQRPARASARAGSGSPGPTPDRQHASLPLRLVPVPQRRDPTPPLARDDGVAHDAEPDDLDLHLVPGLSRPTPAGVPVAIHVARLERHDPET